MVDGGWMDGSWVGMSCETVDCGWYGGQWTVDRGWAYGRVGV